MHNKRFEPQVIRQWDNVLNLESTPPVYAVNWEGPISKLHRAFTLCKEELNGARANSSINHRFKLIVPHIEAQVTQAYSSFRVNIHRSRRHWFVVVTFMNLWHRIRIRWLTESPFSISHVRFGWSASQPIHCIPGPWKHWHTAVEISFWSCILAELLWLSF
jgi:hypothetical protein